MTAPTALPPGFLRVHPHVARNRVAISISRRRIHNTVRDFCTRVYNMQTGERVAEEVNAAAHILAVADQALTAAGHTGSADQRDMLAAQALLVACAARDYRWHPADAAIVDLGMAAAQRAVTDVTPAQLQAAWAVVEAAR